MVLNSDIESIQALEDIISKAKEEYDISEEHSNSIWVALNEAVTNAITHGNKFNPEKKVRISVEQKQNRLLSFIVKDEGEGFDPTLVPDPTSIDRIEELDGRGVFLINRLADFVNYSEEGTCVEMVFDLNQHKLL